MCVCVVEVCKCVVGVRCAVWGGEAGTRGGLPAEAGGPRPPEGGFRASRPLPRASPVRGRPTAPVRALKLRCSQAAGEDQIGG